MYGGEGTYRQSVNHGFEAKVDFASADDLSDVLQE